ncbi:MAG: hypothetical protein SP4CHLAM5_10340 [Chlamydiia bacterium]|nr:hypothetical protein [Chlamydiia bacterium]MCH9618891.1 hypothetical protein [Chlamydiia bacterium]MCH9624558.1 hypothetical protein [Chlamydiia bacterium]
MNSTTSLGKTIPLHLDTKIVEPRLNTLKNNIKCQKNTLITLYAVAVISALVALGTLIAATAFPIAAVVLPIVLPALASAITSLALTIIKSKQLGNEVRSLDLANAALNASGKTTMYKDAIIKRSVVGLNLGPIIVEKYSTKPSDKVSTKRKDVQDDLRKIFLGKGKLSIEQQNMMLDQHGTK